MAVTAQFAIIAGGVLNHPKTPKIPGLDTFSGQRMHTGRWKYDISGGAHPTSGRYPASRGRRPASWAPEPPPSSWQSPVFARWADELHVFQRTPSNVDGRDQRRTNAQEWWRARNENWCGRQAGRPRHGRQRDTGPMERIHDQTCRYLTGGRAARAAHRGADTRARPPGPSQRPPLNSAPKAWYPIWCKRPRRRQVVYLTGPRSTRPWAYADRAISTTRAARGPCPPGSRSRPRLARGSIYPLGRLAHVYFLERWRAQGTMEGVKIAQRSNV